ncbi:MAG: PIN domain-containing protein [Actinomycetota bacterium]|nr:PIN domain-containing protein [Actinomycetota bacterium]
MSEQATRLLLGANELLLTDLVVAEIVYVLQSFYALSRADVAHRVRALLSLGGVVTANRDILGRALDVYGAHKLGFVDAYLVAHAEESGVGKIASFDKGIDRVGTVERVEPAS